MQHKKQKQKPMQKNPPIPKEVEREWIREEYRMKILELQETWESLLKEHDWIPKTEQELQELSDPDLVDTLRQIRNLQGWEGPTLLGMD